VGNSEVHPEKWSKRGEGESGKLAGLGGELLDEIELLYGEADRFRVAIGGGTDTSGRNHPEDGASPKTIQIP